MSRKDTQDQIAHLASNGSQKMGYREDHESPFNAPVIFYPISEKAPRRESASLHVHSSDIGLRKHESKLHPTGSRLFSILGHPAISQIVKS